MGHHHHHHHHHHHQHHHSHGHHHHAHDDAPDMNEKKLAAAIAVNFFLTFVQIVGGLISGSLSLIADALHNFSDAASLVIAFVAIRIGRKPADEFKTFGYKRAETIAALINLVSLVLIGLYLCFEAVSRFLNPEPIAGLMVMAVAGVALLVDLYTAYLTHAASKSSMNMRAAFLHNLTDALASVGVIVAGILILTMGWLWVDALMTLVIAGYVLYHCRYDLPRVIHLLMEGAPAHISIKDLIAMMEAQDGVENVHHVHIWQLDEHRNALEAHVVIDSAAGIDEIKASLKQMLKEKFSIGHSTLEFELKHCC